KARRDAQHVTERIRTIANLRPRRLLRHEPGMAVTERVIADRMTGSMNSPHEIRCALRLLTDREERGLHIRLLQHIEHAWRPFRIRHIVECEINSIRAHDYPTFILLTFRASASRVSQYKRGAACSRLRIRAAGANTHISILKCSASSL